jgi:ADYC domain
VRIFPFVLLVAACGGVEATESEVAALGCPVSYCGSNSPTIDHYGFHELNLDGIANQQGFRILGTSIGSDFFDLRVTGGRIVAAGPSGKLSGVAVLGARIYLEHKSGKQFAMTIADVTTVSEVVPPFKPVETYRFQWAEIVNGQLPDIVHAGEVLPLPGFDQQQDVCPPIFTAPWSGEWNEAEQVPPYNSVVYEGDRIDPVRREVRPNVDLRWFNIGCGHDTLVKLRLARTTMLTAKKNWRLVQATMKMLSADYCGTGMSFTRTGEPLVWRNLAGMELHSTPTSFEARWDENGARCLDMPRAAKTPNPDLSAAFPDIETAIADECTRPPPCASSDITTYEPDDLVLSGNIDP